VIRQLVTEPVEAGAHTVAWDGRDSQGRAMLPGTYVYRVSASGPTGTAPTAAAAEGMLTGLLYRDGQVVFRMGDLLVRQDDIVEVL
jgi:flagellar hook assembly protein FlgD